MTNASTHSIRNNGDAIQGCSNIWRIFCCCTCRLVAILAWIFTLLAIFVEVLSIVGFVVYLREHTSLDICFRLRSLVCSILVLINGVNLLRADDGNAYISAGFTYLVCALPSFSDLLIMWVSMKRARHVEQSHPCNNRRFGADVTNHGALSRSSTCGTGNLEGHRLV